MTLMQSTEDEKVAVPVCRLKTGYVSDMHTAPNWENHGMMDVMCSAESFKNWFFVCTFAAFSTFKQTISDQIDCLNIFRSTLYALCWGWSPINHAVFNCKESSVLPWNFSIWHSSYLCYMCMSKLFKSNTGVDVAKMTQLGNLLFFVQGWLACHCIPQPFALTFLTVCLWSLTKLYV